MDHLLNPRNSREHEGHLPALLRRFNIYTEFTELKEHAIRLMRLINVEPERELILRAVKVEGQLAKQNREAYMRFVRRLLESVPDGFDDTPIDEMVNKVIETIDIPANEEDEQ